jgi:hypothetical protein
MSPEGACPAGAVAVEPLEAEPLGAAPGRGAALAGALAGAGIELVFGACASAVAQTRLATRAAHTERRRERPLLGDAVPTLRGTLDLD